MSALGSGLGLGLGLGLGVGSGFELGLGSGFELGLGLQPDRGHDEEELDEDRAKGQDAAHEHVEGGAHVPGLLRHLVRVGVGVS